MDDRRRQEIEIYLRAANYLAAAQIYLRDNVLLQEPLRPEHLKARLLGHWGTCPGINLCYTALNHLVLDCDADVLLVTGPGHGAAANLANLWLEGTLGETYPAYARDREGLTRLARAFSQPNGFASHLNPLVPGVIHEGGELGYALATAFGAAFDNPDLLVACIVGDGEAETGPTAAAWHSTKFVHHAGDGGVLPILHVNGYKISSPTIFGTMSDRELRELFSGYGWRPIFVGPDDPVAQMVTAVADAYEHIADLRHEARQGWRPDRPNWPMIIARTPKGWTGIQELDGEPVEGTWRAHQVPAGDARDNLAHLSAVEAWLRSYRPAELFDDRGRPMPEIIAGCPAGDKRLGACPHANGGRLRRPLRLPAVENHQVAVKEPGVESVSALRVTGGWLAETVQANASNFRVVCPDELESNLLDDLLSVTRRVYAWPLSPHDRGIAPQGRVMEVLSEHTCQGWLEGYLLTGRHGLFPCYEAFAAIVDSMVNQYAKFLKTAREVPWRESVSALNYLLTSEGWRQEHNGYSHQGPGFINNLLTKKASVTRIYLPPDANTLLVTLEQCLASTDCVNLVVATKQPLPQWLAMTEAREHCRAGASEWAFASSADRGQADVVLASAGAVPTVETLAAAALLRADTPALRVRVVNVVDLLTLQHPDDHPHGLPEREFVRLFGERAPVVMFFHGYPVAVHQLVHHRPDPARFHVKGYVEEGTTTTPFDLLAANGATRFHIAIEALRRAEGWASVAGRLIPEYTARLAEIRRYALGHGVDPPEIRDWTWR
ncbi:MAG: phosphoketolase family protein [Carbonactinosporaceae bacterium]